MKLPIVNLDSQCESIKSFVACEPSLSLSKFPVCLFIVCY